MSLSGGPYHWVEPSYNAEDRCPTSDHLLGHGWNPLQYYEDCKYELRANAVSLTVPDDVKTYFDSSYESKPFRREAWAAMKAFIDDLREAEGAPEFNWRHGSPEVGPAGCLEYRQDVGAALEVWRYTGAIKCHESISIYGRADLDDYDPQNLPLSYADSRSNLISSPTYSTYSGGHYWSSLGDMGTVDFAHGEGGNMYSHRVTRLWVRDIPWGDSNKFPAVVRSLKLKLKLTSLSGYADFIPDGSIDIYAAPSHLDYFDYWDIHYGSPIGSIPHSILADQDWGVYWYDLECAGAQPQGDDVWGIVLKFNHESLTLPGGSILEDEAADWNDTRGYFLRVDHDDPTAGGRINCYVTNASDI